MRFLVSLGAALALAVVGATATAQGPSIPYGSASLLPLPHLSGTFAADATPAAYVPAPSPRYASTGAAQPRSLPPISNPPAGSTWFTSAPQDAAADAPAPNTPAQKNPYLEAMSAPWDGFLAGCGNALAACGIAPAENCGPVWFGGVYGLYMTRDHANAEWFSYDDVDESVQLLDSREAAMQWSGGFETRFGRWFYGHGVGLEAVYWGIFPDVQEANILASDLTGNLNTTFDFSRLNYDNGVDPVSDVNSWFDDAQRHRLRRSYEFHNVELNLLGQPLYGFQAAAPGQLLLGWALGVRYFKFDEGFQFATSLNSETFGVDTDNEMFYDISVKNNLIGPQIGCQGEYYLTDRLSLFGDVKVGLYGNHITHFSRIGGANGDAVVGAGPNAGRAFNIRSTKNDVAMLGELRLGGSYRLADHWRAAAGYRVVALTGVAMTTEQIPRNVAGIGDVDAIDSNGSLILHGGYAGVEFAW